MKCSDKPCEEPVQTFLSFNDLYSLRFCPFHTLLRKFRPNNGLSDQKYSEYRTFDIDLQVKNQSSIQQINKMIVENLLQTELLFCGAGIYSLLQILLLQEKLDRAFVWLSGSQQPGHYSDDCCIPYEEWKNLENQYQIDAKNALISTVKEIMLSLGVSVEDLK